MGKTGQRGKAGELDGRKGREGSYSEEKLRYSTARRRKRERRWRPPLKRAGGIANQGAAPHKEKESTFIYS